MFYVQRTGAILDAAGSVIAGGYAGRGSHKNDPDSDYLANEGPLPRGLYTIGEPHDTANHGPFVLRLMPDPANVMHGRGGFLIHGDSIASPGNASNGCIITARAAREFIWQSGDRRLRVVAQHEDIAVS